MLALLLWKPVKRCLTTSPIMQYQDLRFSHFYQLMLNVLVSWWRGVWYCSFSKYSGHFGEGQIMKSSTGRKEITKILVSERITETAPLPSTFLKPCSFILILDFYWKFWEVKYRKRLVVIETNRKIFTYRYMLDFVLGRIVTHSFFLCI